MSNVSLQDLTPRDGPLAMSPRENFFRLVALVILAHMLPRVICFCLGLPM